MTCSQVNPSIKCWDDIKREAKIRGLKEDVAAKNVELQATKALITEEVKIVEAELLPTNWIKPNGDNIKSRHLNPEEVNN